MCFFTAALFYNVLFYSCARAKSKLDLQILCFTRRQIPVPRIKRKDCKFARANIQPYFVDLVPNYSFTLLSAKCNAERAILLQHIKLFLAINNNIDLVGVPKSWLF